MYIMLVCLVSSAFELCDGYHQYEMIYQNEEMCKYDIPFVLEYDSVTFAKCEKMTND